MLYIQAHPDKSLAEELNAKFPDIYKDANHKPEMSIALTPFEALCGFRDFKEIQRNLIHYPEFKAIVGSQGTCISKSLTFIMEWSINLHTHYNTLCLYRIRHSRCCIFRTDRGIIRGWQKASAESFVQSIHVAIRRCYRSTDIVAHFEAVCTQVQRYWHRNTSIASWLSWWSWYFLSSHVKLHKSATRRKLFHGSQRPACVLIWRLHRVHGIIG